jgi:hypothetical protein
MFMRVHMRERNARFLDTQDLGVGFTLHFLFGDAAQAMDARNLPCGASVGRSDSSGSPSTKIT